MAGNFDRGKNIVPKEIRDYYKAGKRERIGVAWLVSISTLAATLAVFAGVCVTGRWAYDKVRNAHSENAAVETVDNQAAVTAVGSALDASQTAPPAPATTNVAASSTRLINTGPDE